MEINGLGNTGVTEAETVIESGEGTLARSAECKGLGDGGSDEAASNVCNETLVGSELEIVPIDGEALTLASGVALNSGILFAAEALGLSATSEVVINDVETKLADADAIGGL